MSDATLRQVIREAQRAGRLGVLSPEAKVALRELVGTISLVRDHGDYVSAEGNVRPPEFGFADRSRYESLANPGYSASDLCELGAFLSALAELL